MMNIYIARIRNYDTNTERTIKVKAPTLESAKKLAHAKIKYPEGVQYVKGENDSCPNDYENRQHCKRIAEDIEDYYNGLVYKCPECGEIITVPADWSEEKYKCPHCDTVHDGDDLEQLSLYDYFDDVLDIEYRIGSDKQLRSVQIMVTCGGPNIYIDTASKQVELYWWGDRASYPIDSDACDAIDDIFNEYFNC